MIAYIRGILTSIQDESILIDVNGIGYEIVCPNPFVFQESMNKEIKVTTYHHVREDAQILYGFKDEEEKYLFTKLISVSGIGPKGALAVLGSVDINGFVAAIEREDDKFLTSFPGIGKKTARQIILDLKGKLTHQFSITTDSDNQKENSVPIKEIGEAIEALKALGYTEKELKHIQPELQKLSAKDTDEIIRKALSLLMK
ncbi:Holliday junction branch migration protein RuvA [Oceanobacillus senegalensis]|uniref:Holliday junction branch migration protein RuvA n=1 Tax=Oceanobacillus senegalensis TaxID=1936063 RepID=UPI000A3076B6|nr:Holliday junction branch migration protein RuvA [Oceanobacillus senegalensis]